MKIGIVQPYLFPYLGYFQLINSVDIFVIYDDVQYIKRSFINRNWIIANNDKHLFTLSVKKDDQFKIINERFYGPEFEKEKAKLLKTIELNYKKAKYFFEVFSLLNKIMAFDDNNVATFNGNSIELICESLNIDTRIIYASKHFSDINTKGEQRIIDICERLDGKEYINPIGGTKLYSKEKFDERGLRLNFLKMNDIEYEQFGEKFIPNLSIIDVMMFNSQEKIDSLLNEYVLF